MRVAESLVSILPLSETLTVTVMGPKQVLGAIGYDTEISLYSPPLNVTKEEEIWVSTAKLDIEETVTVYLFLPPEQLPTRPKTPTFIPGEAVCVLNEGVVTTAQLVDPPLPLAPPPLPF